MQNEDYLRFDGLNSEHIFFKRFKRNEGYNFRKQRSNDFLHNKRLKSHGEQ